MEEDKKYLKDQIKRIKLEYMPCELFVFDRLIQAIENILNRLEQDKRVIEEMAKYISNFDIDEPICNKKTGDCYADMYGVCKECIIDHFRKKCE